MPEKFDFNEKKFLSQKVIFCTECDHELDNFCLSDKINDVEALKKTSAQCLKNGKNNGGFCSKLFIVSPENFDSFWEEEDKAFFTPL